MTTTQTRKEKRSICAFATRSLEARKAVGMTRPEAARILNISLSTLEKYERSELKIHNDTAARMALVYHDPRLAQYYCDNECEIGRTGRPCDCNRPIESIMLDLLVMDEREIPRTIRELYSVMEGGVILEEGRTVADRCVRILEDMESKIKALELALQVGSELRIGR